MGGQGGRVRGFAFAFTFAFTCAFAFASRRAQACTTFLLERDGRTVVGKSYDWDLGHGFVVNNPKGLKKQALPFAPNDRPAEWVSKHASVTFNQYGREFPNGGLNDAGLVVEVMWLDSSRAPAPDKRATVSELQWIQYQLDNFSSVSEMIEAAHKVRVSTVYGKVHYLACDATNACAAFENLDGQLVVTSGEALPLKALTNHSYADSLKHARAQPKTPNGMGSLDRFARASKLATEKSAADPFAAAFSVLDSVRGTQTQWQIVYDPKTFQIRFRTAKNRQIQIVDAKSLFGKCGDAVRVLDLQAPGSGDATTRFVPFTESHNKAVIDKSVAPIRDQVPTKAVEALIHYPSTLSCH